MNEPEIATHSEIYKIATDTPRAKDLIREMATRHYSEHDKFSNDIIRECRSVLSACEGRNEHHFGDFCSFVSNPLIAFGESGHLANSGHATASRISDIRKGDKPKILVASVPLSHLGDMRIPLSLFTNAVFMAIKMHPDGRAVHAIMEEFISLNLPNFKNDILILRGLGFSAELFIQNRTALADVTSDKAEETIYDQTDIKSFSATSDFKVASNLSAEIGTVQKKGFSANFADRFDNINYGLSDIEAPLISAQEIMTLSSDTQIIRVRGMRPIKAKKLSYWDLAGLRELTTDNPLEGPMPKTKAKAKIKITKNGVKVVSPKVPKRFSDKSNKPKSLLWAINPASFIWLALAAVIYLGALSWIPGLSFPAIRTQLTTFSSTSNYRSCRYMALDGRRYVKTGAQCPMIIWVNGRKT